MSDYISRDAALKAVEETWDGCCSEYPAREIINETQRAIDNIDSVDAVKVTRCSDCIHWEPETVDEGDSCGHCRDKYGPCNGQQTDMNWFCANGEREW